MALSWCFHRGKICVKNLKKLLRIVRGVAGFTLGQPLHTRLPKSTCLKDIADLCVLVAMPS